MRDDAHIWKRFSTGGRWDLVLILESLYYKTYMMRYIAQALFRGFFLQWFL